MKSAGSCPHRLFTLLVLCLTILVLVSAGSPGTAQGVVRPRLLVFVNSTLYPYIQTKFQTYVSDLQNEGYDVEVNQWSTGTAEALKAVIQSRYENGRLKGVVLIGSLPYAQYELIDPGLGRYVVYPFDLFYGDLDGTWLDTNPQPGWQTGLYDGYTPGPHSGLEVYVGRIDGSYIDPLDIGWEEGVYHNENEVARVNGYLDKAHSFHVNTMPRTNRELGFGNSGFNTAWPVVDLVPLGSANCTANGYRSFLQRDPATNPDAYEYVICAGGHGAPWMQQLGSPTEGIHATQVGGIPPRAKFYELKACSTGWFNYSDITPFHGTIANYYIFNSSPYSLAVIASSKTIAGQSLFNEGMSAALPLHKSLGEGFKAAYARGFSQQSLEDETLGYIIFGDPTLVPFPAIYVRPDGNDADSGLSWAAAKRTIGAAIAALPGNLPDGEIWVAAGTYNERITFTKPTRLYGGFAGTEDSPDQRNLGANITIIDGRGGDTVTLSNKQGSTNIIDGFTIRNSIGSGRGIVCTSSPLTIRNATITGNTGTSGGGIYCTNSNLTISGSAFSSNGGTGGAYLSGCTGTISNCTVGSNSSQSQAGGITCSSSPMEITGCTFTGNTGYAGALLCSGASAPTITSSTFTGNTGTFWAGGIHCGASASITKCTLTGNTGQLKGGAISCASSSPSISLCTISGNNATAAGVYCEGASPTVVNCMIRGNTGAGVQYWAGSSGTLINNLIIENTTSGVYTRDSSPAVKNNIIGLNLYGIWKDYSGSPVSTCNDVYQNSYLDYIGIDPGLGDISADPMFADYANGNLHLVSGSPCVDTGTNSGAPTVDWEGFSRPFDGNGDGTATCDMGIYELRRIYVKADSPGPVFNGRSWATAYHTIQQGLNAASARDEVWVAASTYAESVHMKNGIKLLGGFAGRESVGIARDPVANVTLITGGGADHAVEFTSITDGETTIDGFRISNSKTGGIGVYAMGSQGQIINNTITGNTGGGISCINSWPTIARNTIVGNSTAENGGGIRSETSGPNIINNVIKGNSAQSGAGIYMWICEEGCITGNTIIENNASVSGDGIYFFDSWPATVNNIVAFNSHYGITVEMAVHTNLVFRNNDVYANPSGNYHQVDPGTNDISQDPLFANRASGDLHLTSSSPCLNAGDNAYASQEFTDMDGQPRIAGITDIGADEYAIMHVSTSGNDSSDGYTWAAAKRTVQAALNAAPDHGEVWVKAGTYVEHVTMRSGIRLYGGFAGTENALSQRNVGINTTTIDCGDGGNAVTMSLIPDPFTAVDGFTVRSNPASTGKGVYCSAASGRLMNNTITGNKGGGILCENRSTMTITSNTISGNGSATAGGGIRAANSMLTVTGNTITGNSNSEGGGIYTDQVTISITGNTFTSNNASYNGGAIACSSSVPNIVGNTITGNSAGAGAGIYIVSSFGSGEISANTITNNTSTKGGGVYTSCAYIPITNNIVAKNSGGGLFLEDQADFPVTNNTIVDNTGSYGGIHSEANGAPTYKNNIVAFNTYGIYNGLFGDSRANPVLSNNDVFGSTNANYSYVLAGTGDISKNPFFVKRSTGDYHLRGKSPCIDAGTNTGAPTVDKDGRIRPIDGDGNGTAVTDMGAYERPTSLSAALSQYADGTHLDLWAASVTACFAGADPSGKNWVYVEAADRTAGIRVKTDKTFTVNQTVGVSGTIQTDTTTGERYIEADSGSPEADGGTLSIAAIGMRNKWLGGQATGHELAIKDGFGLYNVGLLVQTWGRVTYVNSGAHYFYINDGSRLEDGSGYIGVRVIVPTGVNLPAVGNFVKVKGISGAIKIGAFYVRALRARSQSDITTVTAWSYTDILLTRDADNVLTPPGIPADPAPESVFVAGAGEPGLVLAGLLRRYDSMFQMWVYDGGGCAEMGDVLAGDGFVLYVPSPGAAWMTCQYTPAEGDQFISLPVGSETAAAFSLIGNPLGVSVPWSQCLVADGDWTGTLPEAVDAGMIHKVLYWNGSSWQQIADLSTATMDPMAAYQVYPRYNGLALIVPAQ